MREEKHWVICDVCGKRMAVDNEEDTPVTWFSISIKGRERKPTPPDYASVPTPSSILIYVGGDMICCSKKCVRKATDELLGG